MTVGICGRGYAWQGACMAGAFMADGIDLCGRGHAWQGVCVAEGHAWQGAGVVCMPAPYPSLQDTARYGQ